MAYRPAHAQHATQQLTETYSFPHDSTGIFLSYPTRIHVDSGEVFVLDFQANAVFRFSDQGAFLGSIGEKGQGPGEFQTATDFWVQGDTVWVADAGNHRLQSFDREGHNIDVTSWPTPGRGFVLSGDEVIWQHGRSGFHSGNDEDDLFIRFDLFGNQIATFGSWIDYSPGLSFSVSNSFTDLHDEKFYALSAFYPLLRVYSLSGEVLETQDLAPLTESYKTRVPQNYEWDALSDRNSGIVWTRFLFRALRVNDHGIFVGLFERSQLIVDQFSLDGQYLGRFVADAPTEDGFYLHDFEIVPDGSGNHRLMALLRGATIRVSVFPFSPFLP